MNIESAKLILFFKLMSNNNSTDNPAGSRTGSLIFLKTSSKFKCFKLCSAKKFLSLIFQLDLK